MRTRKLKYSQTKKWERACIKTRRNLWLRKRRLENFGIKKTNRILDLGCGDGLDIKILRSMDITNIVGVDISKELLSSAKKANPGIKFYLASAERLPFKNQEFDVVLADSVFHHLYNHPRALEEIRRILVRRGKLLFVDPHGSILRKTFDLLTLSPISYFIPFLKSRRVAYLAEKDLIEKWLENEKNFLVLLEMAGFKKEFVKYHLLSVVGKYYKYK